MVGQLEEEEVRGGVKNRDGEGAVVGFHGEAFFLCCGCVGSPASGCFVHSGLFPSPSGQMVGGRTSRGCAEVVAVGSRLWVELFSSGIRSFSLDLVCPFGEEGTMGAGCKRGQVQPEPEAGMLLLLLRFKLFLPHPSSLISASLHLASVFHCRIFLALGLGFPFAIRIFLVQSQALGRTSEYHVENTDPSLPHHWLSFLSHPPPGVQDILSLIAETDHECDLRPAAIVGQVERVLSGNSGDAT